MRSERWDDYIGRAEMAWFRVFDAGEPSKATTADGAPLLWLPPAFCTRRKIYSYFRRWWGPCLASNMLCNLPLAERGGRLCMIGYDFPPVSMTARQVERLSRQRDGGLVLQATLSGGYAEEQIRYLVRSSQLHGHPMIVTRSGSIDDFRYQACRRAEE